MHGRIPKKICETVLQKLTDQAHLVCKEFGKAKVYLANQDKFPETNPKQLEELDETISGKRQKLEEAQTELKNLQAKLKELTASMSNQQYEIEIS